MKRKVIKPKTRFSDLVEFYKEVKAMENLAFARLMAGIFDEDKALFFLKQKKREIENKYSKMLYEEDKYIFPSLGKMRKFLEKNGFVTGRINESVKHESAHYREALSNGFNIRGFLCWLAIDNGKKDYICSTQIAAYKMPAYDAYKKASNAPKNLSIIDRMAV
ncbi:hypothetical protein J4433_00785 [Candidatus Pacearchaeota archaeon]|nr:hypothetical protein [Candidatus Pacearchaeota archaeon]